MRTPSTARASRARPLETLAVVRVEDGAGRAGGTGGGASPAGTTALSVLFRKWLLGIAILQKYGLRAYLGLGGARSRSGGGDGRRGRGGSSSASARAGASAGEGGADGTELEVAVDYSRVSSRGLNVGGGTRSGRAVAASNTGSGRVRGGGVVTMINDQLITYLAIAR